MHAFGPGHLTPAIVAAIERETGELVQTTLTGDEEHDLNEERYLVCDACGLGVPIADNGGVW